jgi:hypothetical protein
MLNLIRSWNRHFWQPCMNLFDVFCIMIISSLIINSSVWWVLTYLVTIPVSVHFQNRFSKKD